MAAINLYKTGLQFSQRRSDLLGIWTSAVVHQCQYSTDNQISVIKNPTTASLKRGTGGRSSFNGIICTVFGNTGFLGRYVCNRLGKTGTQMILPYRGEHYHSMKLKLCGDLGQVLFHPFHLQDEDSIRKCIKYSHVVVNLIGSDWETKNFNFTDVHVDGARTLARLAREAGVERFVHVSTLNASPNPTPVIIKEGSKFYKSKWAGEEAVKEEFPNATIVRPSVVYGAEDRFFNAYCSFWRRHFKGIPLWEKGEKTIKQPVWAGDVGGGIAELVRNRHTAGKTYQFVGPDRYKLSDLIDWLQYSIRHDAEAYGYRRWDMKKTLLYHLKINFAETVPTTHPYGYMHWEGMEREHTSDVVHDDLPTLEDLGIKLARLEDRMFFETRVHKIEAHYMEQLGEFVKPPPPKPVDSTKSL